MSTKNPSKLLPAAGRDYRIPVMLAAGLFIGLFSYLISAKPDSTVPEHVAAFNNRTYAEFSAKMRPFLFLPIEINRAEKQLLETIPGIGPQLAEKIVLLRTSRNGFHDLTELLDVKGIGPQKFAEIKKYCCL